jgi:hypothetical protein
MGRPAEINSQPEQTLTGIFISRDLALMCNSDAVSSSGAGLISGGLQFPAFTTFHTFENDTAVGAKYAATF